ncbi:MAG TPA: acetate kinase [Bacilli bacterium]|nr:acetate kinase [Bacilli bacterium]
MSKKVMAVNAGSSSVKFKLFNMPEEVVICSGMADRVGWEDAQFKIKYEGGEKKVTLPILDHEVAVKLILDSLIEEKIVSSYDEIEIVGHRVVQGGKYYDDSVMFDDQVAERVTSLISLAPLHNKPNLMGFETFKKLLPNAKNVAVFDTSFHQTMAPQDYMFPIPYEFYEKYDIRRYGFHGTSHKYLSIEGQKLIKDSKTNRIVTCHIGSGASITAIRDGKCVATSMGLTPLGGVMMGTRTGDIDPSVMWYACKMENKDIFEMYDIFNKKSGMLGVSGFSNDSRDIDTAMAKGDERAILTDNLFIRRTVDFIAQYIARLGGADLIVFSAGIGENSPKFRRLVIEELKGAFGLELDEVANKIRGSIQVISTPNSKIKLAVIPTDEELMIARDCMRISK